MAIQPERERLHFFSVALGKNMDALLNGQVTDENGHLLFKQMHDAGTSLAQLSITSKLMRRWHRKLSDLGLIGNTTRDERLAKSRLHSLKWRQRHPQKILESLVKRRALRATLKPFIDPACIQAMSPVTTTDQVTPLSDSANSEVVKSVKSSRRKTAEVGSDGVCKVRKRSIRVPKPPLEII